MGKPSLRRTLAPPVGVALAVIAVVAGAVAGAVIVGVVLSAVLWLSAVVVMVLRAQAVGPGGAALPRSDHDPFTLGEPWRFFARDALQAQRRFREVAARTDPGPVRDRLEEIGRRLDDGVEQVWATAQRGQSLRQARAKIDVPSVRSRLDSARAAAELEASTDPLPAAANLDDSDLARRTLVSLQSQLDSAARLDEVTERAERRLTLLQAQLDEAVSRAAELSVSTADLSALAGVGSDVDHVVDEMEALRLALDETGGLTTA